jgi:hypothetical protein
MPGSDLYKVLEENGYNPYSMPDRDFVPLAIVRQNEKKKFERVGLLPKFVKFPKDIVKPEDPKLLEPEKKPDFSAISTSQIDASLGLRLLKNIFAQMDVSSLSTAITFNKINKVELSYTNVISDSIDPVDIASYIDFPATPPESDLISDQLEKNNTYIIYDILKSDSFTVTCHAQEKADAVTEVTIIKNILKDESKINLQQGSDTSLSFKGPGYQTFAIRIRPFWITRDNTGKKTFFFKSKPPSFFEKFTHSLSRPTTRDDSSDGRTTVPQQIPSARPAGKSIGESVILPTGSFYNFD